VYSAVARHSQPLTFTTPADVHNQGLPDDVTPWNQVVLAFLPAGDPSQGKCYFPIFPR
jgi:hypothetical protein